MIIHILKDIRAKLPLKISQVRWDLLFLTISGKNWSFTTTCSWRVIKQGRYICGSGDKPYPNALTHLKKARIIDVDVQSDKLLIDPVFTLSNGYYLEIFSDTYLDPWTLDMQLKYVYIPDPFEPNCFLDENNDN